MYGRKISDRLQFDDYAVFNDYVNIEGADRVSLIVEFNLFLTLVAKFPQIQFYTERLFVYTLKQFWTEDTVNFNRGAND